MSRRSSRAEKDDRCLGARTEMASDTKRVPPLPMFSEKVTLLHRNRDDLFINSSRFVGRDGCVVLCHLFLDLMFDGLELRSQRLHLATQLAADLIQRLVVMGHPQDHRDETPDMVTHFTVLLRFGFDIVLPFSHVLRRRTVERDSTERSMPLSTSRCVPLIPHVASRVPARTIGARHSRCSRRTSSSAVALTSNVPVASTSSLS